MLKTFACIALLALGSWLGACDGDDDGPDDAGHRSDSGMPDAARPDAGAPDASADAGRDASNEAGLPPCDLEFVSIEGIGSIKHVSLEEYCKKGGCPASLDAMEAGERCTEYEDGGSPWDYVDAGAWDVWQRQEGCGRVLFTAPHVYRQFDAETGALVGAAFVDDILSPVPGTSCEIAGTQGGRLDLWCNSDRLAVCE